MDKLHTIQGGHEYAAPAAGDTGQQLKEKTEPSRDHPPDRIVPRDSTFSASA